MAAVVKPRTGAFVLSAEKSEKFFSQHNHAADKIIARAMAHKTRAGMVDSANDDKKL